MDFLLLLAMLLLSIFFSGSETSLFALSETEIAGLAERPGRAGRRVRELLDSAPRLLAALLIGNLVANTVASVAATSMLMRSLGPGGIFVAVPLMTIVLLLVGEITPKLVALRYRTAMSLIVQGPLSLWLLAMRPVLELVSRLSETLLVRLPYDRTGSRPLTPAELATAAELAVDDGTLSETEGRFLARLLRLEEREVREVMTPRPAVVAMDAGLDRAQILAVAGEAGFNRYPVMEAGAAHPLGFFHIKDLLGRGDPAAPLRSGLRAALFVPESKPVAALLSELRTGGGHMAFVVDEHGDFSGLVTLEDCLEALTGPWQDESDLGGGDLIPTGPQTWVVAGATDLQRVNEACGSVFETVREYVTIAGLVMARLGRMPRVGDVVREGAWEVAVLRLDGHRVEHVRLRRDPRGGKGEA